MTSGCEHVQAALESLVDRPIDQRALEEHIAGCPGCRQSYAVARAVDRQLAVAEPPPAGLATAILARVRREHWRAEQRFDTLFNVALFAVLVLAGTAVAGMLYLSGLTVIVAEISRLVAGGLLTVADRSPGLLPALSAATLLAISGLGLWWWAERRT